MNKSNFRAEFRQRRRSLADEEQRRASSQIASIFFQEGLHLCHQRVGLYWPNDGEIDPRPLAEHLFETNKQCFLPILNPSGENSLYFGEYSPDTVLIENRFGIEEPSGTSTVPASELDLILLPLVAFDSSGNRLGMGKGFYDRTLAFTQGNKSAPKLIGLAHRCQEVASIEANPWDIPLNYILTDKELLKISH